MVAASLIATVLLAGCGSSDSASSSSDTTEAGANSTTTTAGDSTTTAPGETTTSAASTEATTTLAFVPAPTGDELATVLSNKCTAFGKALEQPGFGLSSVKQIEDARGVCRYEADGLAQPAVLQVNARVVDSAKSDEKDRELFCADISEEGAANPKSNRAKRIAQQVRGTGLFYNAAGEDNGLATLTTVAMGKDSNGGISLGCDESYAYESRVYVTAPITSNLPGSALVAAHRAS